MFLMQSWEHIFSSTSHLSAEEIWKVAIDMSGFEIFWEGHLPNRRFWSLQLKPLLYYNRDIWNVLQY